MAQYMLLIYEEEVDEAGQGCRDRELPGMIELHRSLSEAGVLGAVRALRSPENATTVRVREGRTEITDGPFAISKEVFAGFYLVECADLDEAMALAGRLPQSGWGAIEVRPVVPPEEFLRAARDAGARVIGPAVDYPA